MAGFVCVSIATFFMILVSFVIIMYFLLRHIHNEYAKETVNSNMHNFSVFIIKRHRDGKIFN